MSLYTVSMFPNSKERHNPVSTAVEEICDDNQCITHGNGTAMCLFDGKYIDGIDSERWS